MLGYISSSMNGQVTGEPASLPWRQLWRRSGPLQREIRKLLALDTFGPDSRWTLTLNSLLTELLRIMADCSGHRCSITSLLLYSSQESSTFAPARPNKERSLGQNTSMASKIRPQVNVRDIKKRSSCQTGFCWRPADAMSVGVNCCSTFSCCNKPTLRQ